MTQISVGQMKLNVTPLTPILGAEIEEIDLSLPIDESSFKMISTALVKHAVIIFHEQQLTPKSQINFSRRFGPLMTHVLKDALLENFPEIYCLSNVKQNGKSQGRAYAGQYWHSDLTYEETPSLGSVLYSIDVPECGGDTLFASTAHAFETLSAPMQHMLEGLTAEHLFAHAFRDGMNSAARKGDPLNDRPPVCHPVVRTHPESGRKCLFINEGFTVRINEMEHSESMHLLKFLYAHMTKPEMVYRHKWRTGDVVIWDNRSLVHRGVSDYSDEQPRYMHRTTIKDTSN